MIGMPLTIYQMGVPNSLWKFKGRTLCRAWLRAKGCMVEHDFVRRCFQHVRRVVKEGGIACLIGPVHPTFWLSRWFADAWMLFPTEDEYTEASATIAESRNLLAARHHGRHVPAQKTAHSAAASSMPLCQQTCHHEGGGLAIGMPQ